MMQLGGYMARSITFRNQFIIYSISFKLDLISISCLSLKLNKFKKINKPCVIEA